MNRDVLHHPQDVVCQLTDEHGSVPSLQRQLVVSDHDAVHRHASTVAWLIDGFHAPPLGGCRKMQKHPSTSSG